MIKHTFFVNRIMYLCEILLYKSLFTVFAINIRILRLKFGQSDRTT